MRRHRVGLQVVVVHLFEPGIFVGRENAVGLAGLGQQLAAFKHHMVFEAVKAHALGRQTGRYLGVAGNSLRLVVVVGEHRLNTQRQRLLHHGAAGLVVQHDQPGPGHTVRQCQRRQCGVQLDQAMPDELDAPVRARQPVQNLAVKDKQTKHLPAGAQGVVQGGVVVRAQVAAKPDQTAFVRFVHAPDVSCTAALGTARRGQRKISLWPWISNRSTSRITS